LSSLVLAATSREACIHSGDTRRRRGVLQEFADVVVSAEELAAVGVVERLRALNALARIGNAARLELSPAAVRAAVTAFRSGEALAPSQFADGVADFVPASIAAAAPRDSENTS
jgi:hypothetical protein